MRASKHTVRVHFQVAKHVIGDSLDQVAAIDLKSKEHDALERVSEISSSEF
jgi:hypothetical protein